MTTITLEEIKREHSKVAEMIAEFERKSACRSIEMGAQIIALNPGEEYAGMLINKEGGYCHIVLLPGERESINWKDAKAWAESIGGSLPNRREQSLLFANLKDQFKNDWYWSGEEHTSASDSAWRQYFFNGYQGYSTKNYKLRARAVRRLVI
ncbi:MAG: hypothetical protein PHW66_06255 [Gallionella sp.]|nr:hypothetical protein [Gallionella sp.]